MRLTKRLSDGYAVLACENCERHEKGCTALYCRNRLKDRLAAYEDTGLTPEQLLPADVAPVVRCRDCKYSYEDIFGRCCSHGPCAGWVVLDDSFCGQGERRADNGKAVDEG